MLMCSLKYNDPYIVLGLNDISTKPKPAPVVQPNPYGIDIEKMISIALNEAKKGVRETNAQGRSYVRDSNWCAYFVNWVADQAAVPAAEYGGIKRSAGAGITMHWYIEQGRFFLSESMQDDARSVLAHISDPSTKITGSGYEYNENTYDKTWEDFKSQLKSTNGSYTITDESVNAMLRQANMGRYLPKEGDLIIFRGADYYNSKGEFRKGAGPHNHIGIVVAEDYPKIYTVEGNTGSNYDSNGSLIGEVATRVYNMTNRTDYIRIVGYCANGGTSRGTVPEEYTQGTGEGK
jgi:hypothetical protein